MSEQGNGGYIRLFRKLLEHPIWTQLAPAVAKVAIYFLLHANYRPTRWYDGVAASKYRPARSLRASKRTALACNISKQQSRDAFKHLARTQFTTYRRTHRWTLVTVLNWSTYQASPSPDDENTPENTPANTQRTLNKKRRSNKHTPPTPSQEGAVTGILLGPDELPFATPLDPQPEMVNGDGHYSAGGRRPGIHQVLERVAQSIHTRHPDAFGRRDCSAAMVEKHLAAILKHRHVPGHQRAAFLDRLDRTHAAMCASEGWQKDGGQYAKALENWLSPTKERYLVEPPSSATEPPRIIL